MSPGLHYDMEDALERLEDDPQTNVLVLTGAGDSWCAGQDLKLYFRETANNPAERKRSNTASHHWRQEILTRFSKPTIAMVNGYCFGGAFTQLCACDFAIAAEDAIFGLSEVNWGIIPGGIVSWNLTDMLLPRHALYYAVTGEPFDGKRAVEIGLVNFAVPKDQLRARDDGARAEASRSSIPACVRFTKEAVRSVRHMNAEEARDYLGAKQDSLHRADKEIARQGRHDASSSTRNPIVRASVPISAPAPEAIAAALLARRRLAREEAMPGTKNIDALFAPRNVALVGASDKNWSARVWENLRRFGFEGGVYPINPNRDQIWGGRCYASLDDLPEPRRSSRSVPPG